MKKPKIAIIAAVSVLVVFLFLTAIFYLDDGSSEILQNNLYFGKINISGLTKTEAAALINQQYDQTETEGIPFIYNGKKINITALTTSFNAELSYQNFYYDRDSIDEKIAIYGRPGTLKSWWQKISGRQTIVIEPNFFLDEQRIQALLIESFPESTNKSVDAAFIFNKSKIEISQERPGKIIDWPNLFDNVKKNLTTFNSHDIVVQTKTEYPTINSRDLIGLEQKAFDLSKKKLSLNFKDQAWAVDQNDIASWLMAVKEDNQLTLHFNTDRIAKYLIDRLASKINVSPQDPRFEIKDNKISSWQLGKDGYELDATSSAEQIIQQYPNENDEEQKIELAVKIISPSTEESFDIKELIGTGQSNFSGSPKNRRHNIAVGAAAVHGLIIKPGEEFSLVKSLGEIDAKSGYLPELVIKENKTIPEYGGGLCQIGTTVFRTALASGLPITARQNHSYRVSYYEPAGTDAAIYDPWPDVRFVNDTGKSILIQARIEKDDVYFDFWGTKDGRLASTSKPTIYNIVKPAATKIIETSDLKPGEKKCTEKAHNGADAYFDYTVIYPEDATSSPLEKTRRFKSHYVPWQEVCLVGQATSSTPITETASSTPQ